jgi:hypothetical protein
MVEWIRRLLVERKSQREIQRITRVDRRTISKIAKGEYPDYEALRRAKEQEELLRLGPLERCPGCGGKVSMPCRACLTRARKVQSARVRPKAEPLNREEPPGLELKEPHRERYELIHDRKKRRGEDACHW